MPSKHQRAGSTESYDTEAEQMAATKDVPTMQALIRGTDDRDELRAYVRAEGEHRARKPVIGAINQRLKELAPPEGE